MTKQSGKPVEELTNEQLALTLAHVAGTVSAELGKYQNQVVWESVMRLSGHAAQSVDGQ